MLLKNIGNYIQAIKINNILTKGGNDMDFSLITDKPINYCVYAHVNKQNGKMYIGITNNLGARWKNNGISYKGCPHLWNAIQKYGWDGFDHIILIDKIPIIAAHEIEKSLIKKYDSIRNGYNIDAGGKGGDHMKNLGGKKAKPIYQYDLSGNFIRKWDRPIDASKTYGVQDVTYAANHGGMSGGFQWSYEYVDKMQPYSTKTNHLYLPIYQYDKSGYFIKKWDTQKEAINKYGVSIRNCIYGIARTAIGYRWSETYVDKLPPLTKANYKPRQPKPEYLKNPNGKYENSPPVYRFNLNGELIKIYDNCSAIDDIDVNPRCIYELCLEINKYVYRDCVWVYEKDAYNGYVQDVIERHKRIHPKIIQYDLDGNYIKTFNSMKEIQDNNFDRNTVSRVCNKRGEVANGFQWRYDYDLPPGKLENHHDGVPIPVIQKTLDGEIVKEYESAKSAARQVGNAKTPSGTHIINVCRGMKKTAYGYKWEFKNKEVD